MSADQVERKLAAIFAADVEGYSRLMGIDEVGTLRTLTDYRQIIDALIAQHRGRIFNAAGDSIVAEFPSVVDAVESALAVQDALREENAKKAVDKKMRFRIGVHVGDVLVQSGNLFGDGVNIAARLEALAEPGCICVSAAVRDYLGKRLPVTFADCGEQAAKNIADPIRTFRLGASTPEMRVEKRPLALPDIPSIAVLPFTNMSGEPEQEYFADGVVEDIITALSRIRWLFVIARNSSFTYKGRAVDIKQVGRELGVRYVLEGSVRHAARRVRITGQLIDAATGAHLWADRFEGRLDDIFDLQDHIAASVAGVIAPKLEQAEIERAKRKPTASLDAYDYYLRGVASFHEVFHGSKDAVSEALRLFYVAIELDPRFASAHGMAAWCYVLRKNYGWVSDDAEESAEAARLAWQAARLGEQDAVALYTGGFALARVAGYLEDGAALIDRALGLDPNLAAAWHLSGWVRIYLGEPARAIDHMARAMRLNPLDPLIFGMHNGTAAAHFLAGRYDEASSWAEMALRQHAGYAPALRMAAASHALLGRLKDAQKFMARMRRIEPEFGIGNIADITPFRGPDEIARYAEGLRLAGLPE